MIDKENDPIPKEHLKTRKILVDEAKAVVIDVNDLIKKFRYFRLIKSIWKCDVEVFSKKVYVLKHSWKVVVFLKIFLKFIDIEGRKKELIKVVTLNKEIPFPSKKKGDDHVDYAYLPAYLNILEAECVEVKFKNCDCFSVITAVVEVVIRIVSTKKELLKVLTADHKR